MCCWEGLHQKEAGDGVQIGKPKLALVPSSQHHLLLVSGAPIEEEPKTAFGGPSRWNASLGCVSIKGGAASVVCMTWGSIQSLVEVGVSSQSVVVWVCASIHFPSHDEDRVIRIICDGTGQVCLRAALLV